VGPRSRGIGDPALGLRRARAATALMLALPGSAYLYQGEELGLPEAIDIPDEARQDPTWARTGGERYGRDGCRVPLPWESDAPAFGFNGSGESWLPQPEAWRALARDAQLRDPASTLQLYRRLLRLRREHEVGAGTLSWNSVTDNSLDFSNDAVRVVTNFGAEAIELPAGRVLCTSSPLADDGRLPQDTTAWIAE